MTVPETATGHLPLLVPILRGLVRSSVSQACEIMRFFRNAGTVEISYATRPLCPP